MVSKVIMFPFDFLLRAPYLRYALSSYAYLRYAFSRYAYLRYAFYHSVCLSPF